MATQFSQAFPLLTDVAKKITSPQDDRYNCIAWAFEDNRRFWWPTSRAFWPMDARGKTTMEAFEDWFEADGWEETTSASVERGYKKVALYALAGQPTHAARLLSSGRWTSKLGRNIDLSHDLPELNGPEYGQVIKIFRKLI
ncbi:hypothetical protein [uncultured Parvibaculum sp.]|uniref:DUF7689 domain-containing protein n=1 Tax=uncultured Parvibaculum sp. TaxID=291828 RepID=UPI0030D828F2